MNRVSGLFLLAFFLGSPAWSDSSHRQQIDRAKPIRFSIKIFSDLSWCGPCQRLHKDLAGTDTLEVTAKDNPYLIPLKIISATGLNDENLKKLGMVANKDDQFPIPQIHLFLNEKLVRVYEGYDDLNSLKLQIGRSIEKLVDSSELMQKKRSKKRPKYIEL